MRVNYPMTKGYKNVQVVSHYVKNEQIYLYCCIESIFKSFFHSFVTDQNLRAILHINVYQRLYYEFQGQKDFEKEIICRYCYQTEHWEHSCALKGNCNSVSSPRGYYRLENLFKLLCTSDFVSAELNDCCLGVQFVEFVELQLFWLTILLNLILFWKFSQVCLKWGYLLKYNVYLQDKLYCEARHSVLGAENVPEEPAVQLDSWLQVVHSSDTKHNSWRIWSW